MAVKIQRLKGNYFCDVFAASRRLIIAVGFHPTVRGDIRFSSRQRRLNSNVAARRNSSPTATLIKLILPNALVLLALCTLFLPTLTTSATQEKVNDDKSIAESRVIKTRGRDSEYNGAILDDLFQEAEALNATVVIISRLGKGEFNSRFHQRRLHNIIERFTYSGSRFSKNRIVAAIGERSASKASIEFFINGKLRFISEIDRGKDIGVDCCERFSQYYPWYRGKRRLNF